MIGEATVAGSVGEPAQEIVNAANDYDLVVMGNRGFGGMDDTQGAVAKFVAENCSKPVIFVKGMPEDWDEDNNFVGGPNTWK